MQAYLDAHRQIVLDKRQQREKELQQSVSDAKLKASLANVEVELANVRRQLKQAKKLPKAKVFELRDDAKELQKQSKILKDELADLEKRMPQLLEQGRREIEEEMARLATEPNLFQAINSRDFKVGRVGKLPLFNHPRRVNGEPEAVWVNIKIFQVIDAENLIAMQASPVEGQEFRNPMFWLKGISTDGMVDEDYTAIKEPLWVSGTKQYSTSGGSTKTVFVLEPFDVEAARPFLKAQAEK